MLASSESRSSKVLLLLVPQGCQVKTLRVWYLSTEPLFTGKAKQKYKISAILLFMLLLSFFML